MSITLSQCSSVKIHRRGFGSSNACVANENVNAALFLQNASGCRVDPCGFVTSTFDEVGLIALRPHHGLRFERRFRFPIGDIDMSAGLRECLHARKANCLGAAGDDGDADP